MPTNLALVVGIDDYSAAPLHGCVNDAKRLEALLSRHHDGEPNFECKLLVTPDTFITRSLLRENAQDLFKREADIALFYFAGHGTENNLGGYLVTQDAKRYDEGVNLSDILSFVNDSPAKARVVILDSCHSGAIMGQLPTVSNAESISDGVCILSACRASEPSLEQNGGGVFSTLICSALEGGGADALGKVDIASIYDYADEALGGWDQRPLCKLNVSKLIALRKCAPRVSLSALRKLTDYFPTPTALLSLNPSFEPDVEPKNPANEAIFTDLQSFRDAGLLVPVGEKHLYYAAMNSKACKLTLLGMHYWNRVKKNRV